MARAKALVKQRRAIVDQYNDSVEVPFQDFAYSSVMDTLRLKMEWLDEAALPRRFPGIVLTLVRAFGTDCLLLQPYHSFANKVRKELKIA